MYITYEGFTKKGSSFFLLPPPAKKVRGVIIFRYTIPSLRLPSRLFTQTYWALLPYPHGEDLFTQIYVSLFHSRLFFYRIIQGALLPFENEDTVSSNNKKRIQVLSLRRSLRLFTLIGALGMLYSSNSSSCSF